MANYKIHNKRSDYIVREDEIYDWLIDKKMQKCVNIKNKPFEFVHNIIINVEKYINYSSGRGN